MMKLLCLPMSCLLFSGLTYGVVNTQNHGLLALYKSQASDQDQQEMVQQLESKLTEKGCTLHREGQILAKQGSYPLPPQNKFMMLACDASQLERNAEWITQLTLAVSNLTVQEGLITTLDNDAIKEAGQNREFIIKISDYNNDFAIDRNTDLMNLQMLVNTRTPRYKNEAMFRIDEALGMQRADEVAIIYYDNSENAQAFRANNDDILPKIGAFNQAHLTQFIYLVAQSNR